MSDINREAIARRKSEREQESGKVPIWKPKPGDWRIYLARPTDGMDGLPWVEYWQHTVTVKGKNWFFPCLDRKNPLFKLSGFEPALERLKKKARPGVCSRCEGGDERRLQFLSAVIPMDVLGGNGLWAPLGSAISVPSRYYYGPGVQGDLERIILREGNIADPSMAILLTINRIGSGQNDTRYRVEVDTETVRKPMVLAKPFASLLRKQVVDGGLLDPVAVVVGSLLDAQRIKDIMEGRDGRTEADDARSGRREPACHGDPAELNTEDADCKECAFLKSCSVEVVGAAGAKRDAAVAEEDAEDDEDVDEPESEELEPEKSEPEELEPEKSEPEELEPEFDLPRRKKQGLKLVTPAAPEQATPVATAAAQEGDGPDVTDDELEKLLEARRQRRKGK